LSVCDIALHHETVPVMEHSIPEGVSICTTSKSWELAIFYSFSDSLLNIDVSNSSENRLRGMKMLSKKPCSDLDKDMESSPKKRRRSRKRSDCESNKRSRHSSGRSVRNIGKKLL